MVDAALSVMQVDGCTVWLLEGRCVRVGWSGGRIVLPDDTRWDLDDSLHEALVERRVETVDEQEAAA